MEHLYCFSIKTGGLILGGVERFGWILLFIVDIGVIGFWAGEKYPNAYHTSGTVNNNTLSEKDKHRIYVIESYLMGFMIMCCFQASLSSILIEGIRQKSTCVLNRWMDFKTISIIIFGLMFGSQCFTTITVEQTVLYTIAIGFSVISVKVAHDLKNLHELECAETLPTQ